MTEDEQPTVVNPADLQQHDETQVDHNGDESRDETQFDGNVQDAPTLPESTLAAGTLPGGEGRDASEDSDATAILNDGEGEPSGPGTQPSAQHDADATVQDHGGESPASTAVEHAPGDRAPGSTVHEESGGTDATAFDRSTEEGEKATGDTTMAGQEGHEPVSSDARTVVPDDQAPVDVADTKETGGTTEEDPDRTVVEPTDAADDPEATSIEDPQAADPDRTVAGSGSSVDDVDEESHQTRAIDVGSMTPIGESETSPQAPAQRYELIEDFARGGLGRIWRARDVRIRREVAYKELLSKATRNPGVVERFIEEGQVTGQLEHPSIVPIYDLGWQENGTPYYAMKLVRGITLKDAIDACHKLPRGDGRRNLAFTKLLRDFIDVCNALAFAHQRGVLHRDLKPLNVMLGDFGETLVLDWGLAKLVGVPDEDEEPADEEPAAPVDRDAPTQFDVSEDGEQAPTEPPTDAESTQQENTAYERLLSGRSSTTWRTTAQRSVTTDGRSEGSETLMGSVMGTPAYMPPEQAEGDLPELDARSDIYSAGAILYEILLNRQPIPKGKLKQMLRQVVEGTITSPRRVDPGVPRPLEAICMKALQKRKEDRYQSALELASDVEAYLADEPVSAYREPWYHRLRRWVRRHRTLVTSTVATLAVAVAGLTAWSVYESRRIAGERAAVEDDLAEARQAVDQGRYSQARDLLNAAATTIRGEEALSGLSTRLENVGRLRTAALREDVQDELAQVRSAVDDRQAYEDAKNRLTRVLARLENEPELKQLRAEVAERLDSVDTAIAEREAKDEARQTFAEFQQHVDQARFHGSLFTGESVLRDSREARRHALEALRIYGLDEMEGRNPLETPPPYLADKQVEQLRHDAFELMLVAAEAEVTLAGNGSSEEQETAAEKALDWTAKAKKLGLTSRSLHLREAQYLSALGRDDEAEQSRRRAEAITPSTALDFFLLAESSRKAGDFAEALRLYQRALRVDTDHFWSLNHMGLCHLQQTRRGMAQADAAVASYTAAISRRPDFFFSYLTRALAYAEMGQTEEALADFERAVELNPEFYGIYLNRGAVYVTQGEYERAAADFRHAAELRPELAAPYINLGEMYRQQAERTREQEGMLQALPVYQKALDQFARAAELEPENPKIYQLRGEVQVRLGATDAALQAFRQAVDLHRSAERVAYCYREIGALHHAEGERQQALNAYDRSLALNPRDAKVVRARGEILLDLGRHQEAVDAFTQYLDTADPEADVYRARGSAYAKLGQSRNAMNDYTRALELQHQAPNMLARRGWKYILNWKDLALQDFQDSVEQNPGNADSWLGLAYTKVLLGRYKEGVADAEEGLERARPQIEEQGARAWPLLYNAATVFGKAVGEVGEDAGLAAEERETLQSTYTERAVKLIRRAADLAGSGARQGLLRQIRADEAFDPIRERSEFQKLLDELSSG